MVWCSCSVETGSLCGDELTNPCAGLMHVKGGVLYLVRSSEIETDCSNLHNEVDMHCLVSIQVSFSYRNEFGRFSWWLMHVNGSGSRLWVEK